MRPLMVATPSPPGRKRSWEVCNGWASFAVQREQLRLSGLASGIQRAEKNTTKKDPTPPPPDVQSQMLSISKLQSKNCPGLINRRHLEES